MLDLIVRGGLAVTPEGDRPADILLEGGRIAALAAPGTCADARETLDATGCYVLPGVIDAHVHFRTPGLTHKEDWPSASAAAVAGGVTSVLDMPNVLPPTLTAEALAAKEAGVRGRSRCHYGFYGGLAEGGAAALPGLLAAGVIGIKVFLGETTASIPAPDDAELLAGLAEIGAAGLRTVVHAENGHLLAAGRRATAGQPWSVALHGRSRPAVAEVEAVARICVLGAAAGAPVAIAHVSTAGAVTVLRAAKAAGVDVRAEACPHHLLLTADAASGLGTLGKVNPPLRNEVDRAALWQGITDGTIDQIGSDHAPHTAAERAADDPARAPSGFAGVQNTLPLLWGVQGLRPAVLVRLLCEAPARTWGLWPRKGHLAAGADADLAIVRPSPPRTAPRQWSRHPASPLLERCAARAEVVATVVGGRLAFTDGGPVGTPGGMWLRP